MERPADADRLTLLLLLLLNLCRQFCRAGDPQRRLRLLYDLSEALAWEDKGHNWKPGSVFPAAPQAGKPYSPTVATVAVAVVKIDLPQLPQ